MIEQVFYLVKKESLERDCFFPSLCYIGYYHFSGYQIEQVVYKMCGRYQFTAEQSAKILQIIQEVRDKFGTAAAHAVRQGDVKPGCKMPVLIGSDEGPTPELLVWGFRTPKSILINARAETVLMPTEQVRNFSAVKIR